jgi:undecaprenyl pyrophosphate phosphatase UppP
MVSGWYIFNKDRKTSIRLTWFIIFVLIMAVVFGLITKTKDSSQKLRNEKQVVIKNQVR